MCYFTRVLVVVAMVQLPLGGDVYAMPERAVVPPLSPPGYERAFLEGYDQALQRYQHLADRVPWQPVVSAGLLRPGQSHVQIERVRQRLAVLGDHPLLVVPQVGGQYYDAQLAMAVRRFQARHGLKVDAIIGPNTRRALNVTPARRLQQLRLNQHRQQRFFTRAETRYLQVNIPEYQLRLIDGGHEALTMKVIVGRADRPTPRLVSVLETLVVNPDWNVPRGIAYKDIVPALRADNGALARKGLRLVEGRGRGRRQLSLAELDWGRLYLGPSVSRQRFWQPPGGSNPLGNLKFTFPNRHTVYMHGTPQMSLFDEPERALSSGCIRLEKPRQLAQWLVQGDARWPDARLGALLARQKTRHFRLPERVPLYLSYWTAWPDGEGRVHFRADIYQQDQADFRRLLSAPEH